ncbi:MAG TPA: DEAD/DEAH box helicase [Phycisphaerales bacterium]|nr:DEAD/DEAH box helicase [Phycisphaerales bacterium]
MRSQTTRAMLSDLLRAEFDPAVRKRGELYAWNGSIRRVRVDGSRIEGEVRGSERYDVLIQVERHPDRWDVLALCTCPYAASAPCKHTWGLILKAQGRALALWGPPPGEARLSIDEDEFAEELGAEPEPQPRAARVASAGSLGAGNARVAELKRLIESEPRVFIFGEAAARLTPDGGGGARPTAPGRSGAEWMRMLERAPREVAPRPAGTQGPIGPLRYIIDVDRSHQNGTMTLALAQDAAGARGAVRRQTIAPPSVALLSDAEDRAIAAMLVGAARPGREWAFGAGSVRTASPSSLWQVDPGMFRIIVPMMLATGRLWWTRSEGDKVLPVRWEDEPWELAFLVRRAPAGTQAGKQGAGRGGERFVLRGGLVRAGDEEPLDAFDAVFEGEPGLALRDGALAPLKACARGGCIGWLRQQDGAEIRARDALPLLRELHRRSLHLPVRWPAEWPVRESADVAPAPCVTVRPAGGKAGAAGTVLEAMLSFRYGEGVQVEADGGLYASPGGERGSEADDQAATIVIRRRPEAERLAAERLGALGLRAYPTMPGRFTLSPKQLGALAAALVQEGWEVRGEQGVFRAAGKIDIRVTSGIDWFDVEGSADFGGASLPIAALLTALKKGERFVALGDGSHGILPEEWLERHAGWMRLGEASAVGVRFARTQLGLIDALLQELPEATCDEQVAAARRELAAFEGVTARDEPRDFRGGLRPYQRIGLGWLHFLDAFGFGGCLADDMGLGKTVQVLAFLAERAPEASRSGAGPWLVVAPRSLVFNWVREAARFAPGLRVVDYTGPDRRGAEDGFAGTDLVVTTYGTLRSDIERLRRVEFAGAVLDEAQAIKNAQSQSAKAARLVRARRRLALTGTPVENSLDDLWSIFEFLNPGMLGSAAAFGAVARSASGGAPDMAMLRRALKPFILRRTKQVVAPELPERTEQTIVCELVGRQRTIYDGLRRHYVGQLLGRIDRDGMQKSRMHVLEALLRLRQAACHARLVDPKAAVSASAKVETLLAMLDETAAEGNKALVFSQFTSLLDLVQRELDARGMCYERLDGETSSRERAARVDRFQGDGACPVFLISLKAGGVGLNLTAAQYVFLLDPWWNPAAEAQAIDRTHRIGQSARVSAYRLIAKDTVEERILELQSRKRELAEAIVAEQSGALKGLSREDLEWLLS